MALPGNMHVLGSSMHMRRMQSFAHAVSWESLHSLVTGCMTCQVLPDLLDVCPEARINLAVHYLRQGQLQEAFKLIKDLQPATPQEYTLKGSTWPSYVQICYN